MDIGSLLAALTAADAGAKESNPFAPLQSASDGIASAFIQNSPKFDTKDNLLGGLLLGLTSGITGNLVDNYQDKQNSLAQKLLVQAATGNNVLERPDGLSPTVFSKIQNTGNLFAIDDQIEKSKEIRQAELDVATTVAKQKALLELQKNQYGNGALGQISNLPQALQDDAIKQVATAEQSKKAQDAIDTLFEKAKEIKSWQAAIPGTTAANDMSGVKIGLTNMLQSLQGREMNDQARQALQPALPDWNDTKDQIEQKKILFKQMMGVISPSTPLVSGSAAPSGNGGGYEIRTAPNGQRYKVLLGK